MFTRLACRVFLQAIMTFIHQILGFVEDIGINRHNWSECIVPKNVILAASNQALSLMHVVYRKTGFLRAVLRFSVLLLLISAAWTATQAADLAQPEGAMNATNEIDAINATTPENMSQGALAPARGPYTQLNNSSEDQPGIAPSQVLINGWISPTASGNHILYVGFGALYPYGVHLGQDMEGNTGDPVYALADGTVIHSSTTVGGYGPGDTAGGALVALFTVSDGSQFKALYGHINNPHANGAIVAGEVLGTMNAYVPSHLHFGINPGSSYQSGDTLYYRGRVTEAEFDQGKTYGWVDPINFLNTHNPSRTVIAPVVTNDGGASSVTSNSARLNGEITNTGGENPTVRIYYGPINGGTNPGSWANYAEGMVGLGLFKVDLSGLTSGTPYYYRCYASNSAGSSWASSTATFTTLQGPINTPNTPSIPSGPTTGAAGTSYSYSTSATDPNGDQVKYTFDWGDGTTYTTGFVNSGTPSIASHSWSVNSGSILFNVKAKATDITGLSSGWSNPLAVTITAYGGINTRPNTASGPSGPISATTGVTYSYSTSATDPDGDQVKLTFSWGDETTTTTGFVNSGAVATASHSWDRFDADSMKVFIYARATDIHGASSLELSNPFEVQLINPVLTPTVTNGIGTTLITSNSARLNGEITNTGGQHPSVAVYWGPSDGGTNMGSWAQHSDLGALGKQTFGADISGLTPGTQYYYRCYASNSAGSDWADSTTTFRTKSPPNMPSIPSGPTSGIPGNSYIYTTSATDPDGDQVKIWFNWDDGSPESLIEWVNSGTTVSATHSWNSAGTYYVKALATDGLLFSSYSNLLKVDITTPQIVALQASNGQYVCAEGSGGGAVVANRNAIGAWETLKIIDLGDNNVALQAANGQYLCAEGSGGGTVVADRNAIGAWETFTLVDRGNGYYALRASNGQYVCAEGGGGDGVVANRNTIAAWETFRFMDLRRPAKVALQAASGQYVCAEGGGGDGVVANRNAIAAWETFKLLDRGNGNVALQADNGQYVCAEGGGGDGVGANRNAIGEWETFGLLYRGNGNVALQAANGKYVCAEGGGGDGVVANRNAIGAWETFKLNSV